MDQPIAISTKTPPVIAYGPRPRPVVTYVLLALNLAFFVLMTLQGGSERPDVLLDFGASYGPYLRRGEYWRLVMPMFLHIGWLHLLVNSFSLLALGAILEPIYGAGRFSLIYVCAGASGSLFSMIRSNSVGAGASGAIFGIAGAMVVVGYLHRDMIPPRIARLFRGRLPILIIINLVGLRFVRIVDNWAHLGGLGGGMLLALLLPPPRPPEPSVPGTVDEGPSQAALAIPLVVVGLAIGAMVKHFPTSRAVVRLLGEGRVLRAAHQNPQAQSRFERAARLAPRDERPHQELGSLYLQEKRVEEAVREFNEALRLNPDSLEAKLGLAVAYRQRGDLAKARELIEGVVGKNPRDAQSQEALADLFAEQKLYPEAIQHYREALRLEPNMAEAHNNLAWLFATAEDVKFRNPRGALDHAQLAVELTRWRVAAFVDTLAEAFYANRNFAEAVRVQTKALQLEPNNAELQAHMARYRKAAGT